MIFNPPNVTVNACENANKRHAKYVPKGFHFPKITAAKAIKPWPQITAGENCDTIDNVMLLPANPAINPESITQMYLIL